MLLGHYGVAFAAKRIAPRASLGITVLAAEWLDELWPILLLAGVERVRIVPGLMAANPLDFEYYPFSHSLVAAIIWSLFFGLIYYVARRDLRTGTIVGLLVLSHWILDLPMHRPDLPLWPGSRIRLGLGAWNSISLTILLELVIFLGGLATYIRTTRARDRIGSFALWAMVLVLLAIFFSAYVTPPPPNEPSLAIGTLGLWLFIPWGYWVDRHRVAL